MQDKLNEVIISVTNRCNLRCVMCQIPLQGNNEMPTEQLKGLITDAANLNPNSIVFSGGEPLLRKDIFELISFVNRRRINTCLTSNGTLIDKEISARLSSSGIGVVNISIEGPEDIHDSLRGKGSFRKSVEALRHLSQNKVETTIASIVCRQNYDSLPFVMELAHQFGVTTVKFQPFSDIFLIRKNGKKDFFAPLEALKEIKQRIEKVIELSRAYKISTNPANYLYSIPLYLCGLWPGRATNGCSALWHSCPISAEGNVYLCWTLSNKILGNVRERKLSRIWNSSDHDYQRQCILKEGCLNCLMSCYDYNFGKLDFQEAFSCKVKKFRKLKFYKRQYYRLYQYAIYIFKKVINRLAISDILYKRKDNAGINGELNEIRIAKRMLSNKLSALGRK